jgi:hypothetical protein
MDEPTAEPTAKTIDPTPLAALAFLAPWAAVSVLLPDPQRVAALALVGTLAVLLIAAGAWAFRYAREKGRDAQHWAFLTVVTFGAGMAALLVTRAPPTHGHVCVDCGRTGALDEPFCFGCGSA